MSAAAEQSASAPPGDVAELEELLSRPTGGVIEALRQCPGDILVLGAAGKMGPTLARMARRTLAALGRADRVIAVSRFSDERVRHSLEREGMRTIRADLANPRDVAGLPEAPNVIWLAGQKFGTSDEPGATWLTNVVAPALAADRFASSRVVALSTGNVYPFVLATRAGASESDEPAPVGEYGWSCLARERVFFYAAHNAGTPVALVRLNYANDLRYGVITDIAVRVHRGEPVSLEAGWVNVIWQGDANARVLQCLPLTASPPFVLNVTGAERLAVRELAERLGAMLGTTVAFTGSEPHDALLSDARRSLDLFGPPTVSAEMLLAWTAAWVGAGLPLLDKPTRFEARDGAF